MIDILKVEKCQYNNAFPHVDMFVLKSGIRDRTISYRNKYSDVNYLFNLMCFCFNLNIQIQH